MCARSAATATRYRDRRHLALSPSGRRRRDALPRASHLLPRARAARRGSAGGRARGGVPLQLERRHLPPLVLRSRPARLFLVRPQGRRPSQRRHRRHGGQAEVQARLDPAALATADREAGGARARRRPGTGTRAATPTISARARTMSAGAARSSSAMPPGCPRAISARASGPRCARVSWPRTRSPPAAITPWPGSAPIRSSRGWCGRGLDWAFCGRA